MKISFDKQFVDVKGATVEGEGGHAGKNLASMLWSSSLGDSIKFAGWAMDIMKSPHKLDLSVTDKDILIGWLETINKDPKSNLQVSNGVLNQLVQIIKSQTDEKK